MKKLRAVNVPSVPKKKEKTFFEHEDTKARRHEEQ
jgi:hypothetical protein